MNLLDAKLSPSMAAVLRDDPTFDSEHGLVIHSGNMHSATRAGLLSRGLIALTATGTFKLTRDGHSIRHELIGDAPAVVTVKAPILEAQPPTAEESAAAQAAEDIAAAERIAAKLSAPMERALWEVTLRIVDNGHSMIARVGRLAKTRVGANQRAALVTRELITPYGRIIGTFRDSGHNLTAAGDRVITALIERDRALAIEFDQGIDAGYIVRAADPASSVEEQPAPAGQATTPAADLCSRHGLPRTPSCPGCDAGEAPETHTPREWNDRPAAVVERARALGLEAAYLRFLTGREPQLALSLAHAHDRCTTGGRVWADGDGEIDAFTYDVTEVYGYRVDRTVYAYENEVKVTDVDPANGDVLLGGGFGGLAVARYLIGGDAGRRAGRAGCWLIKQTVERHLAEGATWREEHAAITAGATASVRDSLKREQLYGWHKAHDLCGHQTAGDRLAHDLVDARTLNNTLAMDDRREQILARGREVEASLEILGDHTAEPTSSTDLTDAPAAVRRALDVASFAMEAARTMTGTDLDTAVTAYAGDCRRRDADPSIVAPHAGYHHNASTIAEALHRLAEDVARLGNLPIAETALSVNMQIIVPGPHDRQISEDDRATTVDDLDAAVHGEQRPPVHNRRTGQYLSSDANSRDDVEVYVYGQITPTRIVDAAREAADAEQAERDARWLTYRQMVVLHFYATLADSEAVRHPISPAELPPRSAELVAAGLMLPWVNGRHELTARGRAALAAYTGLVRTAYYAGTEATES